jgi:hypothetical protein
MEAGMRFSLRSLLVVTAAIAVYCAVFFALPAGLSVITLWVATGFVMPTGLISGIVYGKGYLRAFCIGGIGSSLWIALALYFFNVLIDEEIVDFTMALDDEDAQKLQLVFVIVQIVTLLCGLTAAAGRWLCLSRAARLAAPTIAIEPQDMAGLYTILQGRMAGSVTMESTPADLAAGANTPA